MKKQLQKNILLCLAFALLSVYTISCNSKNERGSFKRLALPGEDTIDLKYHVVDGIAGVDSMRLFRDNIRIVPNVTLHKTVDDIDINAFEALRDYAKKIDENYAGNFILALKIRYGLTIRKRKINALYEPLFLKRISPAELKENVEYQAYGDSYSYKYDSSIERFVRTSDSSSLERYKNFIRIQRVGSNRGRFNHVSDADSTSDVREVVFSFQEIDSLILGNPSTKYVHVLNAAERKTVRGKNYFKHIILLGPDALPNPPFLPTFYMKYANLSHLCPPSCAVHAFNLKK